MNKTLDEYFADWEGYVFGFGYETGEQWTLPALRAFLLGCDPDTGSYAHDAISEDLGETVTWLLINILAHADVIEYGTSPRFGWLTDYGKRLRAYVASKTNDELYDAVTRLTEEDPPCYPDHCNCWRDGPCDNPFWKSRRTSSEQPDT